MVYSVFVRKHYRCNIVDSFLVVLLLNGASVVSKKGVKKWLKVHEASVVRNPKQEGEC